MEIAGIVAICGVVKTAVTLVQDVRKILSILQGESRLVVAARKLSHSCQLYEDCLSSLLKSLNGKQVHLSMMSTSSSYQQNELKQSLEEIQHQVEDDSILLKQILDETKQIEEESFKKGTFRKLANSLFIALTKKEEGIKNLEESLMTRVKVITLIMMKDIWKAANGIDTIMDDVKDVDGALYWCGCFGTVKEVSLALFIDSYQVYITSTYMLKRLPRDHIRTLLRHTLLSNPVDNSMLESSTVTITMFAWWLQRYGPMSDTLLKASVLVLPSTGNCISWFRDRYVREKAYQTLRERQPSKIEDYFILRSSSIVSNHFVLTCRLSEVIQDPIIMNGDKGYFFASQPNVTCNNIVDLIQRQLIDKSQETISKFTGNNNITLSRDSIHEWDNIFRDAIATLPQNHYPNIEDLNIATNNLLVQNIPSTASRPLDFDAAFSSFRPTATNITQSAPEIHEAPSQPIPSIISKSSNASLYQPKDKGDIGKYLIHQGLQLLQDDGQLTSADIEQILSIINRRP